MPGPGENNNGQNDFNLTEWQKNYRHISRHLNAPSLSEEDSQRYGEFLRWTTTLNSLIEDFYTPVKDEEHPELVAYPKLDKISVDALRKTYERTQEECEKVLSAGL